MNRDAGTLHVLSTVAMKGVLDDIAISFQAATGQGLSTRYGPGNVALGHLQAGCPADVVILGSDTVEQFAAAGFVVPGSQQPVATSYIGVAVRRGAPTPKLDTVEDFKTALRSAASVAYTDPTTGASSGVHMAGLLERFGMLDEVRAKAKLGDGGPVARYVAAGEAELAIQQIREHMLVEGVDVAGPLPPALQKATVLAAALATRSAAPETGEALIRRLAGAQARSILPKYGLEPAPLRRLRHKEE